MEFIKQGDEVLYVWHGQQVSELEQHVNELKTRANVRVENAEVGLPQGTSLFVESSRLFCLHFCLFIYLVSFSANLYRTAAHSKSSFNVTLVNVASNELLNDDTLKILLNLTKPKGKVVFHYSASDDFQSRLVLTGFVNVTVSGSTIGKQERSDIR